MAQSNTHKSTTPSNKVTAYLFSLSDRIVGYFFPVFLLLLESFLRSAFQINTRDFIGPTLASVGVGMIIPLTSYRSPEVKLSPLNTPTEAIDLLTRPEFTNLIKQRLLFVETQKARVFKNFCWFIIFVLVLLWVYSITLSTKSPSELLWIYPKHYYPGIISYTTGVILSEVKEIWAD